MRISMAKISISILAGLFFASCGLITAPLSVPATIAANANFSLRSPVVDSHGMPLDQVLMAQSLQHQFWTPIKGYAITDEHELRSVDKHVEVDQRGTGMQLKFERAGFHEAQYSFQADQSGIIMTPQGFWMATPNFPIVLYPDKPDVHLASWRGIIDYSNYPRAQSLNLANLAADIRTILSRATDPGQTPDDFARAPAGTFYLTLTPQSPTPINSSGEVDAQDVNLPAEITLHITGENNGFIPIITKQGYAPFQTCDTAPTDPYAPTLTIHRARLKQMRGANMGLTLEPAEYFFFQVNGHFGKGRIGWSRRVEPGAKEIAPAMFYFVLFLNPKAGDVDLTSFVAQTRGLSY